MHARHAWVGGCRVRARSSFVVAGRCRHGGALSSGEDGRPWVVGRGVVLVPGVVAWVSFVGAGCCSWALGALCGCWASFVGAGSCVGCGLWVLGLLRVRLPRAIVVGRDVVVERGAVVGSEVVVACCRGFGSQLV